MPISAGDSDPYLGHGLKTRPLPSASSRRILLTRRAERGPSAASFRGFFPGFVLSTRSELLGWADELRQGFRGAPSTKSWVF